MLILAASQRLSVDQFLNHAIERGIFDIRLNFDVTNGKESLPPKCFCLFA